MRRAVPLLAVLALVAVACGGTEDRDEVRGVVERFYAAVRQDRADEACALLSVPTAEQLESQTQQDCPDVITRLDYDGGAVVDTHVSITGAKVDLRNEESVFLGQGPRGWRLTAIACRRVKGPPQDEPLDCEVEA